MCLPLIADSQLRFLTNEQKAENTSAGTLPSIAGKSAILGLVVEYSKEAAFGIPKRYVVTLSTQAKLF